MDRILLLRAAGLYVPLLLWAALARACPRSPRQTAGMLLGVFWCLPTLLALQLLNLRFGWWNFHAQGGLLRGMPVDLFLGWALLWGAIPAGLLPRLRLGAVLALVGALDFVLLPLFSPVLELKAGWWGGEMAALLLVLLPAQLLARWTTEDTHLPARTVLHVISSGAMMLFVLPEGLFALTGSGGWELLVRRPGWVLSLELQAVGLLAVMGVSAVQEFAQRGGGTPIPNDPPKRLVTSGMYRYVANPMQISCALLMTAWGVMLGHAWVLAAGIIAFVHGLGLAEWDETEDLRQRFGERWESYRRYVRPWRVRWRPWHDPEQPAARLYLAEGCLPCSAVRGWFEQRHPQGLAIVAAEDHPARDLERITYEAGDGSPAEEGVKAFARGLEHLHFGWAFLGAVMRLPLIRSALQVLMDASGPGPRRIQRRPLRCSAPPVAGSLTPES